LSLPVKLIKRHSIQW